MDRRLRTPLWFASARVDGYAGRSMLKRVLIEVGFLAASPFAGIVLLYLAASLLALLQDRGPYTFRDMSAEYVGQLLHLIGLPGVLLAPYPVFVLVRLGLWARRRSRVQPPRPNARPNGKSPEPL